MEADDEGVCRSLCVCVCACTRVMDSGKGRGLDFAMHAALTGIQSTRIRV